MTNDQLLKIKDNFDKGLQNKSEERHLFFIFRSYYMKRFNLYKDIDAFNSYILGCWTGFSKLNEKIEHPFSYIFRAGINKRSDYFKKYVRKNYNLICVECGAKNNYDFNLKMCKNCGDHILKREYISVSFDFILENKEEKYLPESFLFYDEYLKDIPDLNFIFKILTKTIKEFRNISQSKKELILKCICKNENLFLFLKNERNSKYATCTIREIRPVILNELKKVNVFLNFFRLC